MARRIIAWTFSAKQQLKAIFEYFNFRNKSKLYSLKLNTLIQNELKIVLQQLALYGFATNINELVKRLFRNFSLNKLILSICK